MEISCERQDGDLNEKWQAWSFAAAATTGVCQRRHMPINWTANSSRPRHRRLFNKETGGRRVHPETPSVTGNFLSRRHESDKRKRSRAPGHSAMFQQSQSLKENKAGLPPHPPPEVGQSSQHCVTLNSAWEHFLSKALVTIHYGRKLLLPLRTHQSFGGRAAENQGE